MMDEDHLVLQLYYWRQKGLSNMSNKPKKRSSTLRTLLIFPLMWDRSNNVLLGDREEERMSDRSNKIHANGIS